jgi:hypothetical protein
MAKGLESERRQIEAEELKLKQRRERLTQMERAEAGKLFEKSSLRKLSLDQLGTLSTAIKKLGIGEVLKRLS